MHTYTIEHMGQKLTVEYQIDDDTLTVFLPNGSMRSTELRGLSVENAISVHLKSYINTQAKTSE